MCIRDSDEILCDPQAQSAAPFSSRNQRIEHAFANCFRNPRSIVDDLDLEGEAVAFLGQRSLAQDPRAQHDFAIAAHRLRRIARDVEKRLDQLLTIAHEFRQAGVVIAAHCQRALELGGEQTADALKDFVDIDRGLSLIHI